MNGKGDKPRPYNKTKYNKNYSEINWRRPKTISEECDLPKGSFKKCLEEKKGNSLYEN